MNCILYQSGLCYQCNISICYITAYTRRDIFPQGCILHYRKVFSNVFKNDVLYPLYCFCPTITTTMLCYVHSVSGTNFWSFSCTTLNTNIFYTSIIMLKKKNTNLSQPWRIFTHTNFATVIIQIFRAILSKASAWLHNSLLCWL